MKVKLLKQFMFASKQMFYIFLLQLITLQLVNAHQSKSQSIEQVKITVGLQEAGLEEIFSTIEAQTDFVFVFDAQVLDAGQKSSLDFKNRTVADILKEVAIDYNLNFRQIDNTIFVKEGESTPQILESAGNQQPARQISGKVTDGEGIALPGVSVIVKGSTRGTVTDIDGTFSLEVTSNEKALILSFIGMKQQEVNIAGLNRIDVSLEDENLAIDEVVVTALGLTREEKSLGYSVSKLNNDDINQTTSTNWLNGLSGKVAGLVFDQAGTGPGGSMRVTLRGDQSLNYDNNEALFVVDGVPINSGTTATATGTNYANADSPVDYGNGASDINPEDIESVSVLKGPAATALYGSRAANGAIIITTKSGRTDKGLGISVNSTVSFEQAGYWPDFQTEYGAGNGYSKPYSFWTLTADQTPDGVAISRNYSRYAFGEKFNPNEKRYLYASKNWETNEYTPLPWQYADNWYTGIFRTGITWDNTVTISGNSGKGTSVRLSLTDSRNDWILPNTGFTKQNIALTLSQEVNPNIKIQSKVNYYRKDSDNMPMSGYDESSVMYQLVWGQNVNDINKAWKAEYENGRFNRENYEAGGSNGQSLVFPSNNTYNPYRTLYEELNKQDKDRVFGNIGVKFTLAKGVTLDVRSGLDMNVEFRTQQKPKLASDNIYGFYREQTIRQYEINNDFLLQYEQKALNKRLGMTFAFGGNNMNYNSGVNTISLERLDVDNFYSVSNTASGFLPTIKATRQEKEVNSLYGFAQFSWNDTYFLDVTGRNDWSSTLSANNNSYFYPSVSASILLDKVMGLTPSNRTFNLLKLRASWANVGNDTSPYALDTYYSTTDYSGSYRLQTTLPDPNIKPENVESTELGLEGRFFNNRVNLDLTAYNTSTTDQIVNSTTDRMSGASAMKINVGEIRNRGIEIAAGVVPFRSKNGFNWSFNVNWSRNWNKLVSLSNDWDPSQPLQTNVGTTIGGRTYIYSYVGESMHVIYGKDYQRAPEGTTYIDANGKTQDASGVALVDPATGYPILDSSPETRIGNVNPDWRAGMTQTFAYKNLSLNLTFSAQWGGNTFSVTNFALSYQGKLKNSLEGRYDGLVHPGLNAIDDGSGNITYVANETITKDIITYYNKYVWVRDNTRNNTFDTSFLKLKEVRLNYSLPARICKKTGFLQGASLSVFATNVFTWTDFPQFDPETGALNGSSIYRGIETMSMPLTRTYGVSTKLTF
ncbi:MAG: SusC/RagA family TonB-linked outer membrane protein [Mangrovibacterium sp.]